MRPSEIERLRARLVDEATRLAAAVERTGEQARAETIVQYRGEVHDPGEEAAADSQGEVNGALLDRHRAALAEVRAALSRVERGTYGACTACGEPVAPGRLEANPAAARCGPCQSRAEA